MKNLILLLMICFTGLTILYAQDAPNREKFDPTRDPAKEVAAAVKEASKSGKNILLDVGGEWCKWCHAMDKFIADNTDIKNFIEKNFIVVKVNYSKENKNEAFLAKYPKIEGYPHLFVLDKKGKLIHSQNTGDLELDKSYDPEKYMAFLKKFEVSGKTKKKVSPKK